MAELRGGVETPPAAAAAAASNPRPGAGGRRISCSPVVGATEAGVAPLSDCQFAVIK